MLNTAIKFQYGRVTYSIIGDSISASAGGWQDILAANYNAGLCTVLNNAVGSATVIADMDSQTNESETNNADFTLILLGANDAAPPLPALTVEYQENLIELYGTTGKPIYCMGMLDNTGWTDENIALRGDEIEAAVTGAAATGVDVTFWDTLGWIDATTDTSDGVHPTAGGHAKIAAEVLALLPAWTAPTTKYLRLETTGKVLYG